MIGKGGMHRIRWKLTWGVLISALVVIAFLSTQRRLKLGDSPDISAVTGPRSKSDTTALSSHRNASLPGVTQQPQRQGVLTWSSFRHEFVSLPSPWVAAGTKRRHPYQYLLNTLLD